MSGYSGGNNWSVTAGTNNQLSNLTYDSAGEVTEDQYSNRFTYDAEGRILTGGTGTYVYDGGGNRVKKTVSGTTTLYWPGAGSLLNESNSSGSTMGKQVRFDGLLVWHEDSSATGEFLFHDQLGSVRVTGSASGTEQDDNDYQSFGTLYHNYGASPSDNHYLFTGDESDSETSTDYAMYRNLELTMGRFNRPDPYDGSYDFTNPQSLNRYSYALNNPLVFFDPSGLDDTLSCDGNGDVVLGCGDGGGGDGSGGGDGGGGGGGANQGQNGNGGPPTIQDPWSWMGPSVPWDSEYGFAPPTTVDGMEEPANLVAAELNSGAATLEGGRFTDWFVPGVGLLQLHGWPEEGDSWYECAAFCASGGPPVLNVVGGGPQGGGGGGAPNKTSSIFYKVTCFGNLTGTSFSKRGCSYACGGEEEMGPYLEFPTAGVMYFTQNQLTPVCGSLSEVFCPSELTVEGNYDPITGFSPNPYITSCKQ